MPTVSICLPVYNGATYLAKAIESALTQSYENFELLISDDCSTDETPGIVQTYAKQDKRIKAWVNATNLGHYPNYNACIEKALGKYIKLFAQDDILHPTLVERFVSVFEENANISLVNCARRWIDTNGQTIKAQSQLDVRLTKPFAEHTSLSGAQAIISTLSESINWLGEPSSQMFRSEFIDGGFDCSFRQIGDIEYNYRQLQRGDFYFVADILCDFRKHTGSWTTTNRAEISTYLEWLLLASKYSEYLSCAGLTPERYCLNFIKAWSRNLEEELFQAKRFGAQKQDDVLRELCGNVDPLSLFNCPKNGKREHVLEYRALGALALLQSSLLENELRIVNEEVARPYTEIHFANDTLFQIRPGIAAALQGMKQTLQERDKEIDALRLALSEMGNSISWKVTEPLRKLKGRLR